jgi:hypothetical protein
LTNSKTTCTVSFSTTGANTVVASYSGSTNYAPSTSGLLEETVSQATTTRGDHGQLILHVGGQQTPR